MRSPLPLALAGTTGGLGGLILTLLREGAFGPDPVRQVSQSCPLSPLIEDPPQVDLYSLGLGICIGILLGPLLDLLFLLRLAALRVVRRRVGHLSGWYRVLDE